MTFPGAPQPEANPEPRTFGDNAHARGCPVLHRAGEYVVVGHPEATAVALDPETFSSRVSSHLQLPNGLDGAEHARFRALLDNYLAAAVVEPLAPSFSEVAGAVLADAALVAAPDDLAATFSVRAMLRWLSWPASLEQRLVEWVAENARASRSGDREWTARVAADYDDIITVALEAAAREAEGEPSVTTRLAQSHGLSHAEIVSILRNWTGGDLGSMARCIGVILVGLADQPAVQERLRRGASAAEFTAIADEFLRLDDPFVSNRRVATCPTQLGEFELAAGDRVRLHWTGANRDPRVFGGFDPEGNASLNLVWGVGAHYCPGKPLSMVELQAFFGELLPRFEILSEGDGERDLSGGWARIPVSLRAL